MRRSPLPLAVAATALLTAGCLTLQADMAVDGNDTVSGEMSFTVDLEVLEGLGEMGDMDGMGEGELFSESDVAEVEQQLPASTNARARLIEDANRVGLGVQLDGTPITELPALFTALEDEGDPFPLTFNVQRDGDLHRLSGNLGDGGAEMAMMGGIELDVSITFAGDVQETNGLIGDDGRTVTWRAGGPISATADAGSGGGGGGSLALIIGIVVALLVVAGVVVLVLRSRGSSAPAAQQAYATGQQPGYPQQQPAYPQQQPAAPQPPQAAAPQPPQPAAPQPPQAAAPQPPQAAAQQPAGWYPDPWGQAAQRYWDGGQWTEHTG